MPGLDDLVETGRHDLINGIAGCGEVSAGLAHCLGLCGVREAAGVQRNQRHADWARQARALKRNVRPSRVARVSPEKLGGHQPACTAT